MRLWLPLSLATLVIPIAAAAENEALMTRLGGDYVAVQRVAGDALPQLSQNINGQRDTGIPEWADSGQSPVGLIGQAIDGEMTLAPNGVFTMSMAYFDEGTWEILRDDSTGRQFIRLNGKQDSFDAVFQGEYGLGPDAVGVWMPAGNEKWWLVQFRKTADPGIDVFEATEAQLASAFGQGNVQVDFAEVAKGSATGAFVRNGVFTQGVRFTSTAEAAEQKNMTDERTILIFLPDGRFTISSTISGASANGTYHAEGSELTLRLEGHDTEEVWDIGRDAISKKYAIRPLNTAHWFLEVPFAKTR